MTVEQRFEVIEKSLAGVVQVQQKQAESLSQLMQIASSFYNTLDTCMTRVESNLEGIVESLNKFVEISDRRMTRIEENLDGLIRAITADHSNGKSKH